MKIIISIVFIAVAGLVFYIFTIPYLNDIKSMQAEIAAYNDALKNSKKIQARRDELLQTYNAIPVETLDRLKKLLPSSVSGIKFIVEIEDLVKKHGLILRSIDIIEPKKEGKGVEVQEATTPYGIVPVNISLSGSYESFLPFLESMTNNLRLVDITNVTFNSSETNFYQFNIKASTYYQK